MILILVYGLLGIMILSTIFVIGLATYDFITTFFSKDYKEQYPMF